MGKGNWFQSNRHKGSSCSMLYLIAKLMALGGKAIDWIKNVNWQTDSMFKRNTGPSHTLDKEGHWCQKWTTADKFPLSLAWNLWGFENQTLSLTGTRRMVQKSIYFLFIHIQIYLAQIHVQIPSLSMTPFICPDSGKRSHVCCE